MDRYIGGFVSCIFGCIGVAVILFLWSQPHGQFGSPPVFFRVFGSFIGLVFVVVGFGNTIKMISGSPVDRSGRFNRMGRRPNRFDNGRPRNQTANWDCPNCGSPLSDDNEISPSGDVKCLHCESWYNVNAR